MYRIATNPADVINNRSSRKHALNAPRLRTFSVDE